MKSTSYNELSPKNPANSVVKPQTPQKNPRKTKEPPQNESHASQKINPPKLAF
jgi:hypothetical protein